MIPPAITPFSLSVLRTAWRRRHDPPPEDLLLCGSGAEALFHLLSFLRETRGCRRLLLSPFNCGSVWDAVTAAGITPVLVDFSGPGFALDVAALRRQARPGPAGDAVLFTHLFGFSPGYAEVVACCREQGLVLVEDGAHLMPDWPRSGACRGDAAIFSFGLSKALNLGGGGACWLREEWRGAFNRHLAALPQIAAGLAPTLAGLARARAKTHPGLLAVATACRLTKWEQGGGGAFRKTPSHRRRFGAVTWMHPLQRQLLAVLLGDVAPQLRQLRRDVFAAGQAALAAVPGVQVIGDPAELLADNAPVRIPVAVAPERRAAVLAALRQRGLWASPWITRLLGGADVAADVCPQAARLLERFISLPTGFTRAELPRLGAAFDQQVLCVRKTV
jgi:dTDP-4-amino-4,6-dideoxygalactose transaminase